jgi:hypothetical protein
VAFGAVEFAALHGFCKAANQPHTSGGSWCPLHTGGYYVTPGDGGRVRRGEALGLRWSDVDLDGRTVTIRRSSVVAGGRVVEGEPKTKAGQRPIVIDSTTASTYSHVLPAHDQAAADVIGRSLDGADQALPRDSVTTM